MAFDEKNDVTLAEIGYIKLSEREDLFTAIYSYAGGPPKLGMNRKFHSQRGTITGKLGRLTREEARLIGVMLSNAAADETIWSGRKQ